MNDTLHVTGVYVRMVMKSWFQYKVDAVLRSVAVFLREMTGIIVIYFTLLEFDNLNGWDIHEMLFLFSLLFLTYGILIIFFTGLRDFGQTVRSGNFDRFILRPRGLLFQLIFCNADWFAAIGHGGLGIVLFIITAGKVGIVWNAASIIYYIFAGYPISIFNKVIQACMIYVVPFAFVNYFPAQYLLRKEDMSLYPEIYMYLTPFVGVGLYLMAYAFWRYSIRHYKSTGN